MEKKKGIIITGITLLLLLVVGVTYAFFTYESGTKSDIVTGQIYMNYEETSTISLTGVFPETKEQALARQDENGVFEFTITGRNTSKYPVYYEIDLLDGGVITGKTETSTKILPEHVRIYLERDGEPLVDGMTYKDWNNRRIYVDTVPANQTSNIEHKYTLRMWIDENVTISDTDPNADYTTTEWNDAYTSLKVRVVGDFEWKEAATDASCFAYNVIPPAPDAYDVVYDHSIITLDTSEEKVNTCKEFMLNRFGGTDLSDAQDGYQSYCEGTGTVFDGYSLKDDITDRVFTDEQIQALGVVESYEIEIKYYELNTSEESVNSCKEYMLDFAEGEDGSDAKDGYQSFCEGTGTFQGETIYDFNGVKYGLIERNVFTQVEEISQVIEITNYDETCGTDVIIPSTIEGLPVTRIADGDFSSGVFADKNITNVTIPNTMTYIGISAFSGNPLVSININGNPILSDYSFNGRNYPNDIRDYQLFRYGGTCEELNRYANVWSKASFLPKSIITTDNNACQYTNFLAPQ